MPKACPYYLVDYTCVYAEQMHLTFGLTRMFVKFAKFAFGIIQEIQLFGIPEQLPLVRFVHPSNMVLYNIKT